ncbi:SdpI family protein [Agromyces mangrovi Wang et al. 2018]|uniref:SdpI family protein n=1 Tax=Agromyces mangrovi TaxID=1858653 RepID=UPI0025730AC0|nr:SdpI family protein [Agromyces mangrovi]BDZ65411.1 hypothetical protein GCM10025877_23490 [Agromyces mangrovi]
MNDLTLRVVLCVVLLGTGAFYVWMAGAAATGRLQRNRSAGIRTRDTLASDEAWLAAHVRARRAHTLAGIAAIAIGLIVLLPMPAPMTAITALAGAVIVLGIVLYADRAGRRAAADVVAIGRASGSWAGRTVDGETYVEQTRSGRRMDDSTGR